MYVIICRTSRGNFVKGLGFIAYIERLGFVVTATIRTTRATANTDNLPYLSIDMSDY